MSIKKEKSYIANSFADALDCHTDWAEDKFDAPTKVRAIRRAKAAAKKARSKVRKATNFRRHTLGGHLSAGAKRGPVLLHGVEVFDCEGL